VFSPDGKQLAFMSMRTGLGNVYVCDVRNPSIVHEIVADPAGVSPLSWAANGTLILSVVKGSADAIATHSLGTHETAPYLGPVTFAAALSAEGRRIAYSEVVVGQPQVFVEDFPTHAGRRQVSVNGGFRARWRADGKELFYIAADRTLTSVDMTTDGAVPVPLFRYNGDHGYDVSPDGKIVIAK